MDEQIALKKLKQLKQSENFSFLREKGLEYIQQFAGKIWTDYNIHDPGITILDALCYALTDLGYRTGYPLSDILADRSAVNLTPGTDFFSPVEIFTSSPVTLHDYRKIMIDNPGIRNAWLDKIENPLPALYLNYKAGVLITMPAYILSVLKVSGTDPVTLNYPAVRGINSSEDDCMKELTGKLVPRLINNTNRCYDRILEAIDTENRFTQTINRLEVLAKEATGSEQAELTALVMHCNFLKANIQDIMDTGLVLYPIPLRGLYNVIIELEEDPVYGDLNNSEFTIVLAGRDQNAPEYTLTCFFPNWYDIFNTGLPDITEPANCTPQLSLLSINQEQAKARFSLLAGDEVRFTADMIILFREKNDKFPDLEKAKSLLMENKVKENFSIYYNRVILACNYAKIVWERLQANRNLGEDFCWFDGLQYEEVAFCADIEVGINLNKEKLEQLLAAIYTAVRKVLSPPVTFYSFKERLAAGKTLEEIFEGPLLTNGFIDETELAKTDITETGAGGDDYLSVNREIHASDLVNLIMQFPGVKAVKTLNLYSYRDGVADREDPWSLRITDKKIPHFDVEHSKVNFYYGVLPLVPDKAQVMILLAEQLALEKQRCNTPLAADCRTPAGTNKNIGAYQPLCRDFPVCYGIGRQGLPGKATEERRNQARQLQAYLLFYDQLLANYLAQLAHTRALLSFDPLVETTAYYTPASEFHGTELVKQLFLPFPAEDASLPPYAIDDIVETRAHYEAQRNRILDHLIARFCEQFSEFAALLYKKEGEKSNSELIDDKLVFLRRYPEQSSARSKGMNYRQFRKHYWYFPGTGLKERVCRLLGLQTMERWFRFCRNTDGTFGFNLVDGQKKLLLKAVNSYSTPGAVDGLIREIMETGHEAAAYKIKKEGSKYLVYLEDKEGIALAAGNPYASKIQAESALAEILLFLQGEGKAEKEESETKGESEEEDETLLCEGFYLVEHILLRPRRAFSDALLKVCVEQGQPVHIGYADPYSFRLTAVVPFYAGRFNNMDFRKLFEKTLREEAPAHLHVKICWVDRKSLQGFETSYFQYYQELAGGAPAPETLSGFLETLNALRSFYPQTYLYGKEWQKKHKPEEIVILGESKLGNAKGDYHGGCEK